ncbi:MAG: hypothetical protein J7480_05350 [Microbacteriaceae bacterium]|nr:hypothetical protein [Microbacteriaceae bacterium]
MHARLGPVFVLAVVAALLAGCAPASGPVPGGGSGGAALPDNPGIGSSDGCLLDEVDGVLQLDAVCHDEDAEPLDDAAVAAEEGNGWGGSSGITIHAAFDWAVEARVRRISLLESSCRVFRFDPAVGRDGAGVVSGTIEIEVDAACRGVTAFVADVREWDGSSYSWVVILEIQPPNVTLVCGSSTQSGGCLMETAADQGPSGDLEHRYELTTTISPYWGPRSDQAG